MSLENKPTTYSNGALDPLALPSETPLASTRLSTILAPQSYPMPEAVESHPALSTTPTVGGLMQALRRRWLWAALLGPLAAALVVIGTFYALPPKYVSEVRFRISAKGGFNPIANLQEDVEFSVFKLRQVSSLLSQSVFTAALNSKLDDNRQVRDLAMVRAHGASTAWLEKAVKTDFNVGPEILRATLAGDNADEVFELLNAIADAYQKDYLLKEKQKGDALMLAFKERRAQLEEDVRKLRGQLNSKMRTGEYQPPDSMRADYLNAMQELHVVKTALRNLQAGRDQARLEVDNLDLQLKLIDQMPVPEREVNDFIKADTLGSLYLEQLRINDENISRIVEVVKSPETAVRDEQTKKRAVEEKLKKRIEHLKPKIEAAFREKREQDLQRDLTLAKSKLSLLNQQEKTLQTEVLELEERGKTLAPVNVIVPLEIQILRDKIESSSKTLDQVSQKITLLEFENPTPRVLLEQQATKATERDISRQTKIAGVGGLGAFGLVLFAIAFLEFLSRRISDADEVRRTLGLTVLGAIPRIPDAARASLGQTNGAAMAWQGQLNESVDAVRTMILHASRSSSLRVIMVTSAYSGEGKTSLASQLAASLARAWRKTLLIDADLRNPAAHTLFDVPLEPGFSEVLRGDVQVKDVLRATALSRLWAVPAGNWDNYAIQALAQESVHDLVEQLKAEFEYIIIDAPPVLPVTDSLLLGQHVDGAIFSVLRDVSRAPAIYAAQQKLAPLGIRTLGAVMLGAPATNLDQRYQNAMEKIAVN